MPTELADFVRGILLLGQDAGGDPVAVIVDANGQIQVLLRGQDGSGDPQTVKVDSDGQLFTILRGAGDVDVAVDAAGFLSAILKGIDGTATLRTVATDASGQIIMVPRGQAGNYMAVDASGFLSAILKGTDGGSVVRDVAVDTSGQMIMVPRGSSGNYMLVDSDGYLTAVLKGLEGATLTTISVDDQGRLQAFALDAEDQWGDTLKTGNSELAARLGSPLTYDWRGQTLFLTTFDRGLGAMQTAMSGTGASVSVVPDNALTGGFCVKLVGGSSLSTYANIKIYLSGPPSGLIGGMARVAPDGTGKGFAILLTLVIDGFVYVGGVRLNLDDDDIEYYDTGGTYTKIDDIVLQKIDYYWYGLKVVVNFTTKKYVRAMFGRTEWDLSAVNLVKGAAASDEYLTGTCEVHSRSGENDTVYVDQFCLSVGEPT